MRGANQHDRRRSEILETLVELYLRLNGYFSIGNYLHHRVDAFGLDTESDVLAIRLPYQQEVLQDGRKQPNDAILVLPDNGPLVDCVIAEVKESAVEFNAPLTGRNGERLIAGALRMFGVFQEEAFEPEGKALDVARSLFEQITKAPWMNIPSAVVAQAEQTMYAASIRMIVFAPESAKHGADRKHVDLQHVLTFARSRMRPGGASGPCAPYRDSSVTSASPWRGWARLIVEELDSSHATGERSLKLEDFVARVLGRFER